LAQEPDPGLRATLRSRYSSDGGPADPSAA
jgi:hypothetical protein